ncbi:MAG: tRNA epoxyqueuosine(34) reductase QueG [Tissierellia bacterium]|nr:tRNA epoxyqueuosine(34) reductase QueG [Tissierellia bacterium]
MKSKLEMIGKKLNIHVIGITNASRIYDHGELLYRRNTTGLSPFEEKDLTLRTSIEAFRPGTKSVIVFGLNYFTKDREKMKPGEGKLALISRGQDYHKVLHHRGENLMEALGIREYSQVYVDTHPLLERALAVRSGLGYIGKHTQLIHPLYGSYLVLGLVLTDLELIETSSKEQDYCGDCRKCLDACPGKALSPYRLDPRKCLSSITQQKESITEDLQVAMGNRIYGCDTCQLVCPKNKNVPETDVPEFQPIYENIKIQELKSLSNREFKHKYGMLSGAWRGKKTWIRNGEIILKNQSQRK